MVPSFVPVCARTFLMQDGLTGSAWGDWANYTASPLRWDRRQLLYIVDRTSTKPEHRQNDVWKPKQRRQLKCLFSICVFVFLGVFLPNIFWFQWLWAKSVANATFAVVYMSCSPNRSPKILWFVSFEESVSLSLSKYIQYNTIYPCSTLWCWKNREPLLFEQCLSHAHSCMCWLKVPFLAVWVNCSFFWPIISYCI